MYARLILRIDPLQRLLRLARFTGGTGPWWMFTVGLTPRLYRWDPQHDGWFVTVLGLRLHWRKSLGGVPAR